jgi:CRISPR-associated protein Csm2
MSYFDGENIRKELLSSEAEGAAKQFVAGSGSVEKPITTAQLRKFYNEFKGLEKKLQFRAKTPDLEETAFKGVLPLVKMVKSKVAYASGGNKVPRSFADWLNQHVESINSAREFKAFLLHFEAVVGFCYGFGMK